MFLSSESNETDEHNRATGNISRIVVMFQTPFEGQDSY